MRVRVLLVAALAAGLLATAGPERTPSLATAGELVTCAEGGPDWSASQPPVNLRHIFCGETNRRGRAVGYHALGGTREPGEARIEAVLEPLDRHGVYRARVCIVASGAPAEEAGQREVGCKRSTLFPDAWSEARVLAAILGAYRQAVADGSVDARGHWRGPSGAGFDIEGWLLPTPAGAPPRINTAWPAYAGE